jgi:heme/copper-type cytochrome/quinol oxidase subunit 2
MAAAIAFLPLAVETAAQEGKKVITAMLIVGIIFVSVIALGQLSRWLRYRRKTRKAAQRFQY